MMRRSDHGWNFIGAIGLILSVEKVVANTSRNYAFPVFFQKDVPKSNVSIE